MIRPANTEREREETWGTKTSSTSELKTERWSSVKCLHLTKKNSSVWIKERGDAHDHASVPAGLLLSPYSPLVSLLI